MTATILDGKKVSAGIRSRLKDRVSGLTRKPGLAVVLVGDDPASHLYVANKEKACREIGFYSKKILLPESVSEAELLKLIEDLNYDKTIHGILVQFPLPKRLVDTEEKVIRMIDPDKDVDGFHPINVGSLTTCHGSVCDNLLLPCTPMGIIRILTEYGITIGGKHAVVLGRSSLVGKPVAMLLLAQDATVTVCHSKTVNLPSITRQADILVAAIGKPNYVTRDMVKDGAVIVDVGINRTESGFVGDVDYEHILPHALAITPVPGGIGPMTIAMLMENVMKAYVRRELSKDR